jgi:hypothetical protein
VVSYKEAHPLQHCCECSEVLKCCEWYFQEQY